MTTLEKIEQLTALKADIAANKNLPLMESNLVFGEGDVDCRVLFIGEAPGFNEDQQGRPFVGRGGQLLNQMIQSIGWKREDAYITNIVKRRPPENRDPLPEEIEAYKPYLTRQIEIINPVIIATLGRFSMNYFLPDARMMRDHGRVMTAGGRIIFPILHPAAALRAPEMMKAFQEDFAKLPIIAKGEFLGEVVLPSAIQEKPKQTSGQQENLF